MLIDLHAHSTFSDGTDSPGELMAAARAAGLDVVALTDHDTTAGWRPAAAELPPGLTLLPGAELSCACDDERTGRRVSVHLLAYLFDPQAPPILEEQQRLREERRRRLRVMAARMADDGLPVDADAVLAALPPDSPAGRPHLAQALVGAGVVGSVDEAFADYLGGTRGYYVPRRDTPVEEAIEMVADAGGVTVIAHPFAHQRGPTITGRRIAELARHGLAGVEVDHPNHDAEARAELRRLAGSLGLVATGSSDYHGTNKTISLGEETTSEEAYREIVARGTGAKVETA